MYNLISLNKSKVSILLFPDKCSYHDYYYHYCWRKEVAKKDFSEQSLWDCKGRCKKCQKYRRRHKEKSMTNTLI